MRATAAFTATATDGATRLTTLRSAPPLSLRSTPEGLFLVASGAGPIGGDELAVDAAVEAGATVVLRSAAASMVLPGPGGAPSSMTIRARVGGSLSWRPEPTVLVAGCDHHASAHVSVAPGGRLWWREEVVLGRHDEPTGSLLQRVRVDVGGRPLLRTELPVGPRWPGSSGPAGLDGAGAVGSIVAVGWGEPALPPAAAAEVRAAVVRLADDAWLVTALAARAAELRRFLDDLSIAEPGSAARCEPMASTPHASRRASFVDALPLSGAGKVLERERRAPNREGNDRGVG